jgi:hypothetical protein
VIIKAYINFINKVGGLLKRKILSIKKMCKFFYFILFFFKKKKKKKPRFFSSTIHMMPMHAILMLKRRDFEGYIARREEKDKSKSQPDFVLYQKQV